MFTKLFQFALASTMLVGMGTAAAWASPGLATESQGTCTEACCKDCPNCECPNCGDCESGCECPCCKS